MPVFLADELSRWSGGNWVQGEPESVGGISNDTRTISENDVYIALQGDNHDGHDFVEEAFSKRSQAAIVASKWFNNTATTHPSPLAGALLLVDDTSKALMDIAAGYRQKVDPLITGVTGSAGKSSVKEMIGEILSIKGVTAKTKGNWNNDIGVPLSILAMENDSEFGVFEVGTNHPGEIKPLCDLLKPSCGVVTGIGPAHIGFFASEEAIASEKSALLSSLPADGVSVLCSDDKFFDLLSSAASGRTITVSMKGDADIACVSRNVEASEFTVREKATTDEFTFKAQLPGEYNVLNALFAIAVAREHGIDWVDISSGLDRYVPLPMRWQKENVAGALFVNDAYNANPLSMRAAINAFRETPCAGKKWLVLGGMGELGDVEKEEHIALGEFIAENEWSGLITVGSLAEAVGKTAVDSGVGEDSVFLCKDNKEAAEVLERNISKNDAVLFKASRSERLEEIINYVKQ